MSMKLLGLIVFSFSLAFTVHADPREFRQVSPLLFAGAKPTEADLAVLKAKGVTKVVNLQGGNLGVYSWLDRAILYMQPGEAVESIAAEKALVEALGMEYVSVPVSSVF